MARITGLGCTLGIVPHVLAAISGLAALLHTSAVAFQALRYAGAAYLLYVALSTWRDRGALKIDATPPRTARSVITAGVLINILNPQLTIFFFAFLHSSSMLARYTRCFPWLDSAPSSWARLWSYSRSTGCWHPSFAGRFWHVRDY